MADSDWEFSSDPGWMMRYLRGRCSARKLRLAACACCRHHWADLTDAASRGAVEAAEAFADDRIDADELATAWRHAARHAHALEGEPADPALAAAYAAYAGFDPATRGVGTLWYGAAQETVADWARHCLTLFVERPHSPRPVGLYHAQQEMRRAELADLLREVVGDPARPPLGTPPWLTASARSLAEAVRERGTLYELPVVADALDEAGCTDAELLAHLRAGTPHARGCWALDALTGRDG